MGALQGLGCEPISRTLHRPSKTTASSDDALCSAAPPSSTSWLYAECAALASSVAHFWPHCFPDTRLTSTSTPAACPHESTLPPAVYEEVRRESTRTSRRDSEPHSNHDHTAKGRPSAPVARLMHPHSFDGCNAGWINEDAAANAGLGHERSSTMHLPHPDLPQTHPTLYRRPRRIAAIPTSTAICALLAGSIPMAMAQSCISLADSTACQAFGDASISTDSSVAALFPFLNSVGDVSSFDSGIASYIAGDFTQQR